MRAAMSYYRVSLICAFAAVWVWAAIKPVYPHDWLLENYLVFIFLPLILISGRYFKLSDLSYTLITLFMILHVIGSHYTYAEVPFGETLKQWLGAERNMYDRLVHFTFGFLLAYPMREVFLRLSKVKGFWGFYLPLDVTLSFSALYEIIEWGIAQKVAPGAGIAFLGSQGDIWDAQKDMTMAGIGALLAMIIIGVINWKWNPDFGREFREGFRIQKGDRPLGEEKLKEWLRRSRRVKRQDGAKAT
jgi:putative membrane protein